MAIRIKVWDGSEETLPEGTSKDDARERAIELLAPWTQDGDRVLFAYRDWGTLAFVVDELGDDTDACAAIRY